MKAIEDAIEAVLRRIELHLPKKSMKLSYSHESSRTDWTLDFKGVEEFNCSDFGLQNIMDRILIYEEDDYSQDILVSTISGSLPASDESLNAYQHWLGPKLMLRLKTGELKLVIIEPIFGGEFCIVCKTLEVNRSSAK